MMHRIPLNKFGWLGLSFVMLTLACSLPMTSPAPIIVTATPLGYVAPTGVAGTPPTVPTATIIAPTTAPTTSPNVILSEANLALQNGNYNAAVVIYQSILAQPPLSVDPRLRSDAAFGRATAALREGLFSEAEQATSFFIKEFSTDARLGQAYFLRGDAYIGLGQWVNAVADFETYLQLRPSILDSYAYERIGDAYLALENPAQALVNYGKAVEGSMRGLKPLLALREKVAAAYINQGNLTAAVNQYDQILSVAENAGYRASIALQTADLLATSGNPTAANQRYVDILNNYPDTVSAYKAMQALLNAGYTPDPMLRARASFIAEDFNDVITALYDYTSNTPLAKIDPVAFMMLGQAYRAVGNTAAANTSFDAILTQYPTNPLFGKAWLEQGRTLFLGGDIQGAIAKYRELAEKHPTVPEAAEALWRAGYLYSTIPDMESSMAVFEILGNQFKGSDWAMDGLFRAGMAAYNANAPARAQRFFSLLAVTGKGELQAAGYYWLARLYQMENNTALAAQAYAEAAKADPGGYYSLRANDMLKGQGPFVPPAKLDWTHNSPELVAQAEQWMRQQFNLTQVGTLWELSPTLQADPRMVRGTELYGVAAYDDSEGEFSALTEANARNPLALYQLAAYYHRLGLFRQGIEAAAKLIEIAKIQTETAPKFIASMRYPIGYADLVIPQAQKYNIDPLLVFSLIRQESLFEGKAVSYAAAQGLMQVIPDTANYIAQKLGKTDFQASDIYRPHVNVEFGVYYLYEQLEQFEGNVPAALAAYNAGPGSSSQWLRMSNGDPDMFIQAISYDETRAYVRRIYEQYHVYASIYGVAQ